MSDPSEDPTNDASPHVYEQSIDRLARALGGKAVLPPAFQYISCMLASYDWRLRHAGLMAIAAIGEGMSKVFIIIIIARLTRRNCIGYAERVGESRRVCECFLHLFG